MTREEVKQLLATITMIFPKFEVKDKTATVDAWFLFLEEYSVQDIQIALKMYVKGSGSAYPPSMPQLISMINKPYELSYMNEQEAWSLVRKALSNGAYNSEYEFERLPAIIQKSIGSPNQLHIWATDPEYNESVISSNFMRTYKTVIQRAEEERRMPVEARVRLEHIRSQALCQTERVLLNDNEREVSDS